MNRRKLLIIVTTVFALCSSLFAKGDTYIYDYWGEVEKSPDVYRLLDVMYASDFDLDVNLRNPSGLFANGNLIYLVDTDNNRILELQYNEDKSLVLNRVIDRFNSDKYKNSNMCIIGTSGSGKSYFAKLMLLRNRYSNIIQYVVDPEGEYLKLCNKLKRKHNKF